jgi:hypothetical protein
MTNAPPFQRQQMRKPAANDPVTVRYVLPSALVTPTSAGLRVRTCMRGEMVVPHSVLAGDSAIVQQQASSSGSAVVIEARLTRDVAQLLGSLVAEIARLTRELGV